MSNVKTGSQDEEREQQLVLQLLEKQQQIIQPLAVKLK